MRASAFAVPQAAVRRIQPLVLALQRLQPRPRLRHRFIRRRLTVRVPTPTHSHAPLTPHVTCQPGRCTHVATSCWNMLSTAARRSLMTSNSLPLALAAAADSSPTSEMYLYTRHVCCCCSNRGVVGTCAVCRGRSLSPATFCYGISA